MQTHRLQYNKQDVRGVSRRPPNPPIIRTLPYICVDLTLSEQLERLSAAAHVVEPWIDYRLSKYNIHVEQTQTKKLDLENPNGRKDGDEDADEELALRLSERGETPNSANVSG